MLLLRRTQDEAVFWRGGGGPTEAQTEHAKAHHPLMLAQMTSLITAFLSALAIEYPILTLPFSLIMGPPHHHK